jgi:hypothetical protein
VVPASGIGFERHGRAFDVRELKTASYPTRHRLQQTDSCNKFPVSSIPLLGKTG